MAQGYKKIISKSKIMNKTPTIKKCASNELPPAPKGSNPHS
jgi:hypothetical protein